jgi:uncharacterized protein YndB with AHSA1/START domain
MSETFRTALDIAAPPELVFEYFVNPELLVRWMGDFARLESRAGGPFSVDIHGVLIRGHFVRVERPHLIEVAWGEAGNEAMPPVATRLLVTLEARGDHTCVQLEHSGLIASEAKKHAMGLASFPGASPGCGRGRRPGAGPLGARPAGVGSARTHKRVLVDGRGSCQSTSVNLWRFRMLAAVNLAFKRHLERRREPVSCSAADPA